VLGLAAGQLVCLRIKEFFLAWVSTELNTNLAKDSRLQMK
jgi:hypothetical protein